MKGMRLTYPRKKKKYLQLKTQRKVIEIGSTHWVIYKDHPCSRPDVFISFYQPQILCLGLAEIIQRKRKDGKEEFYVHYKNCTPPPCSLPLIVLVDKRLDEWIDKERFLNEKQIFALEKEGRLPDHISACLFEALPAANPTEHTLTRNSRKRLERNGLVPSVQLDPAYEALEREHEEATKIKNIQKIELGRYEIDCWYFSPYPDEFAQNIDLMFICEKCLKYMNDRSLYEAHFDVCDYSGPPGKLIYMKDELVIFELDGSQPPHKLYCQNLCLLAKLFLDHKTLYYDVSPFFFYLLCEVDETGTHPVGYFSKEKASPDDYNLACIMVLPPYQKKGYGRFLIQLSYELTRREEKTGSPEKPLSDLGRLSYSSFWAYELLVRLKAVSETRIIPTIAELCRQTGFKREDIVATLTDLGLMRSYRGQLVLNMAGRVIDAHLKEFENKKTTLLDPESLLWP